MLQVQGVHPYASMTIVEFDDQVAIAVDMDGKPFAAFDSVDWAAIDSNDGTFNVSASDFACNAEEVQECASTAHEIVINARWIERRRDEGRLSAFKIPAEEMLIPLIPLTSPAR